MAIARRRRGSAIADDGPAPKIALLRGGGLGDFLSTTAALKALRASLPLASITLLTNPSLAAFAQRYGEIDRIVVSPPFPGVIDGTPDEAALADFFRAMRLERFDLAMQWHGGGTQSNDFLRRLGARLTIGFKGEDAQPLDRWIPYDLRQHESLRYLDLLRLVGIHASDFSTYLPLLPSDFEELAAVGDRLDLQALQRGRCMGIHASAGGMSRRWKPQHFAHVADRLLAEFDLEYVVVTAGAGQEPDSAAVIQSMQARDRAVDLGGRISLGALVALISQLRFFLSNDSGPAHMAVALDTPSVVVFGSAHPSNWAPLDRTWHRVVANWSTPCRWMENDGCPDTPEVPCLMGLDPEEVLRESRQLLSLLEQLRWPAHRGIGLEAAVKAGGEETAPAAAPSLPPPGLHHGRGRHNREL
ncbi:MAG: glycosyltransferase family 9 protein [Sphingomonadaceae bacterium]